MRKEIPVLETGKYRILYDLGIHKKAGLSSCRISTCVKAGKIVDIKKIKCLKYSVWGLIEEGWILLFMNETRYAAPCVKKC